MKKSVVMISDYLTHDSWTVEFFIKLLKEYIKEIIPNLRKATFLLTEAGPSTRIRKYLQFCARFRKILVLLPNGIFLQSHTANYLVTAWEAQLRD